MYTFIEACYSSTFSRAVKLRQGFVRTNSTSPKVSKRTWQSCTRQTRKPADNSPGKVNSLIQSSASSEWPVSERVREFLSRAEEGNPLEGLRRAERAYANLRGGDQSSSRGSDGNLRKPSAIVKVHRGQSIEAPYQTDAKFDVIVAGGTLGLFLAVALQMKNFRCAIVERGPIEGREQEWNISRAELATLTKMGLISKEELENVIVSEWNPSRIAFATAENEPMSEIFVKDVLNCGVSPLALVQLLRSKFEALGGTCLEFSKIDSIDIFDTCVQCTMLKQDALASSGSLGAGGTGLPVGISNTDDFRTVISSRLLVDAMGSFSPVSAQVREYSKPDAVCVTVGSCCEGKFPVNDAADLICAIDPIQENRSTQYFWEAFPASNRIATNTDTGIQRRTTYMFAYGKCDHSRPTLAETLDDYLDALPRYQKIDGLDSLKPIRVLFGFFPAFQNSPLKSGFDRIVHVGDAGGLQSPISFGGFATMLRHLPRLAAGLADALAAADDDLLKKSALSKLAAYSPGLSVTWLFNRFMSCRPGQTSVPFVGKYGINRTLLLNMQCMERLGPAVQRPFLQDVICASALTKTLWAMTTTDPLLAIRLLPHIGLAPLSRWFGHYLSLLLYALLANSATIPSVYSMGTTSISRSRFLARRREEAWLYGSGRDHGLH